MAQMLEYKHEVFLSHLCVDNMRFGLFLEVNTH